MKNKIATIISYAFHPLIIPTYALIIFLFIPSFFSLIIPFSAKLMIIGLVLISTFFLPLIYIFFSIKQGFIKSKQMETRQERTFPFLMIAILYYLTYYLLKQLEILHPIYYLFILGACVVVIIALIINYWWKISIHMMAIGGFLGALIGLSAQLLIHTPLLISFIILCSGLIGFARLQLNAHTPQQVYVGFIAGLIPMLLLFLYM